MGALLPSSRGCVASHDSLRGARGRPRRGFRSCRRGPGGRWRATWAAPVEAVHEPERVPHLVDGLGGGAPGEHRGRRGQAVELGAKARQGDDGDLPPELGLAVDEAEHRHEEVALRDPQEARDAGRHAGEQRLEERDRAPLPPRGAEGEGRFLDRVQALHREPEGLAKRPSMAERTRAGGGAERRDKPEGPCGTSGLPAGMLGDPCLAVVRVGRERQRDHERRPRPSLVRTSMWPPCDSTIP